MKTKSTTIYLLVILFLGIINIQLECPWNKEENENPTCLIIAPVNQQEINKGDLFTITVNAEDNDGTITKVEFFIDDIARGTATNKPYTYQWNTANEDWGPHDIKATATDDGDASSTAEITVKLIQIAEPPIAKFEAEPLSGNAPLDVSFTDLSENSPESWLWDFGDGQTSSIRNPSHTFTNGGVYTVTLTVTNTFGSDEETKTDYIEVISANPPVADFSADVTNGSVPLSVIFTDLSTNNPSSWLWNFGDGNTSTDRHPSHSYAETGKFTVTLSASNTYGSDEESKTDYINVNPPGNGIPCPDEPTVTYEGQVYNTVLIGNQCWLKENLNVGVKKNANNNMTDNGILEKWCYGGEDEKCDEYGALYQWGEVMQYDYTEGGQGICPDGWHIPTDVEYAILEGFSDSQFGIGDPIWEEDFWRGSDAGLKLKALTSWIENGNGTDEFGFAALGAGQFTLYTIYLGEITNLWTSTQSSNGLTSYHRRLDYNQPGVWRNVANRQFGFSVRCIKNE